MLLARGLLSRINIVKFTIGDRVVRFRRAAGVSALVNSVMEIATLDPLATRVTAEYRVLETRFFLYSSQTGPRHILKRI